jgi:hypothetical protein
VRHLESIMISRDPRETRDTALRRLLQAKRWILAASIALTGALAGLAANAFPGKTIKTPVSGPAGEQGAAESSSSAEGSSGSLSPPEQAPQAAEPGASSEEPGASQPGAEAPVISGGS